MKAGQPGGKKGEGKLKMVTNPHCDAEAIVDILQLLNILSIAYSIQFLEIPLLESECDI